MATTSKGNVALSTSDLNTVAIYTDARGTSFDIDTAAILIHSADIDIAAICIAVISSMLEVHCSYRYCKHKQCSHNN
jgi:hypothetical protein